MDSNDVKLIVPENERGKVLDLLHAMYAQTVERKPPGTSPTANGAQVIPMRVAGGAA